MNPADVSYVLFIYLSIYLFIFTVYPLVSFCILIKYVCVRETHGASAVLTHRGHEQYSHTVGISSTHTGGMSSTHTQWA